MDINQICITGRLTREPETKKFNDNQVTKFSIACNQNKDNVSFFEVVSFGKTAEICEKYLSKGSKLTILGKLSQNRYEDKEGNKKSKVEIIANIVNICINMNNNTNENKTNENKTEIPF